MSRGVMEADKLYVLMVPIGRDEHGHTNHAEVRIEHWPTVEQIHKLIRYLNIAASMLGEPVLAKEPTDAC